MLVFKLAESKAGTICPIYNYSYMRKLQVRHGDRKLRTHEGKLKTEHRLGSSAVGPPPLIITTL